METEINHRWLMQYQIVNLVNQCRRLIRAEFDDRLSLTDPQLRQKLAHYAGITRSHGLQRLYGEIQLELIKLEGPDVLVHEESPPGEVARMYRGQPVDAANSRGETAPRQRGSRMYRGRPVS
ncbi:hypothetical protein A11A3_08470 [Alcanivorax hongdengensis A-11-3]|uniref:Uncharacterized protein n=1 Tax=Alcanivorax hongdengensis A-11-3 TaxID=1177179 RepID=L0WBX5_9GAMM|nr:hypothetical protein [Alcanivorax hongdengensis]EKF74441.1 hypothetical protein A11A3_08470 [Alcanivorax hongdengensis A-11-3]